MSPKLLHQSFQTDHRMEITFADASCPLYMATESDNQWLDTSLMLEDSELYQQLCRYHYSLLDEKRCSLGLPVEHLYSFSPSIRDELFTLRVAIRVLNNGKAMLDVMSSNNCLPITLPIINLIEPRLIADAQNVVLLWEYDNDLRRKEPSLWMQE